MNSRELCLEQACKLSRACELARVKLSGLYCISWRTSNSHWQDRKRKNTIRVMCRFNTPIVKKKQLVNQISLMFVNTTSVPSFVMFHRVNFLCSCFRLQNSFPVITVARCFLRPDSLKSHIAVQHTEGGKTRFKCDQCGRRFSQKGALKYTRTTLRPVCEIS